MKCTWCRKVLDKPFKTFAHEHDAGNKYKRMRKPVHWCEPCWTDQEAKNKASLAAFDKHNQTILESLKKG